MPQNASRGGRPAERGKKRQALEHFKKGEKSGSYEQIEKKKVESSSSGRKVPLRRDCAQSSDAKKKKRGQASRGEVGKTTTGSSIERNCWAEFGNRGGLKCSILHV